jgi:hypothetical protein
MWKWFVGIAVVLIAASIFVTNQYENACETQKRQTEKNGTSVPIPFVYPENNNPKTYTQECKEETPWWEKLVAWPDGITALALILTLAAIAAQATLMSEHAETFAELAKIAAVSNETAIRTLDALKNQSTLMQTQAEHTRKQADLMEQQAKILETSVAISQKSADAAVENIAAFRNKERARIQIEIVGELNLVSGFFNKPVKINVHHYGATEAFIKNHGISLKIVDSEKAPDTGFIVSMRNLPSVIVPKTPKIEIEPIFPQVIDDDQISQVKSRTLFVHLNGFIEFDDIFETPRRVSFRKIWNVTKYKNFSRKDGEFFALWSNCIKPDDPADY